MSYASSVLQPGETIIGGGRLHWIIYGWAIFFPGRRRVVVLGFRYVPQHDVLIAATAVTFGVLFLGFVLYAWFIRWITDSRSPTGA